MPIAHRSRPRRSGPPPPAGTCCRGSCSWSGSSSPHLQAAQPVLLALLVRDDDHRQVASALVVGADRAHQLQPVHARHVHVADDQVEAARPAPGSSRPGRPPPPPRRSRVAQQLPLHLADRDRVVHHQHALAARRRGLGRLSQRRSEPVWMNWSIERIRSSTSAISTGEPSSRMAAALTFGTLPSRGSSGRTTRSCSPRNASTISPYCPSASLSSSTGSSSPGGGVPGQVEQLGGQHQADVLPVHGDELPVLQRADLGAAARAAAGRCGCAGRRKARRRCPPARPAAPTA